MGQSKRIWVCVDGKHCCQRNPGKVFEALQEAVVRQGASDQIEVIGGGCLGMCGYGPNALVMIGRSRIGYSHLRPSDADEIISAHTEGDRPVERLRLKRK
jgi:(2Fe-2S) ferredoxin